MRLLDFGFGVLGFRPITTSAALCRGPFERRGSGFLYSLGFRDRRVRTFLFFYHRGGILWALWAP